MTTPEMLAHIRADVQTAMIENRNDDPALLPDLLDYLLTEIGKVATTGVDGYQFVMPQTWADWLLAEVRLRAVSAIPFAERDDAARPVAPDWRQA